MRMRLFTACLLTAATITLTSCTGDADGLGLNTPSNTTSAPTTASSPTATSTVSAEEQAVLDAYQAFYDALAEAYADPQGSQDYLEPVATGAQFEQTNGAIKANFLAGEQTVGSAVLDPVVTSIEGTTATVHDCQDTSGVETQKIEGGEVLEIGRNPSSVEAILQKVDGVWKVAANEYKEPPGAYCS